MGNTKDLNTINSQNFFYFIKHFYINYPGNMFHLNLSAALKFSWITRKCAKKIFLGAITRTFL